MKLFTLPTHSNTLKISKWVCFFVAYLEDAHFKNKITYLHRFPEVPLLKIPSMRYVRKPDLAYIHLDPCNFLLSVKDKIIQSTSFPT